MLDSPRHDPAEALRELERQVARDLDVLRYPAKPWTRPVSDAKSAEVDVDVLDVLIVGGGQSGLSISFALKRMCIDNTLVVDERP
ncbi:MAG: NAD(P)/FAD-dependent oxidoreductase, partial [Alphaproteobacteria bacterium]|nr:NAD(P)/FAD-dependent oxidoreductase [Alphaproteobacteria bacterium]